MKKTFLLIFLSWLLFFIVIPPLHTPDETEHYENTFWLSRFIYPYQPKDRTKPKLFVDGLMKLYLPFDINTIKNSPLKRTTYSEEQIKKMEPITLQSYHPPFYYFLLSFSHHLSNYLRLDLISRFYITRLFSSLFYFGTVLLACKILKILFIEEFLISSLLLFFSLNPLVVKSVVGINPDNGMTFFSILFLYLIMKWQKTRVITLKQTIILSLVAAASTLSKFSGVFTLLMFPLYAYTKGKISSKTVTLSVLFFTLSLIFMSPWFLLNLSRYGGLSPSSFQFAEYRTLQPHNIFQAMILSAFEFRHTIIHYAGFLGPTNNINPPKLFFLMYTVVVSFLSLIGFITLLIHSKNRKKFVWIIVHFLSLVAFLFVLGTYFKKEGFSWDLQGRYFVPGFFSMTIFIYFGILKLLHPVTTTLLRLNRNLRSGILTNVTFGYGVKNNDKLTSCILFFSALIHFYYILFFVLIPFYYPFNTLLYDLGLLYSFFNILFIGALISHVVLSFSIIRRLFSPISK